MRRSQTAEYHVWEGGIPMPLRRSETWFQTEGEGLPEMSDARELQQLAEQQQTIKGLQESAEATKRLHNFLVQNQSLWRAASGSPQDMAILSIKCQQQTIEALAGALQEAKTILEDWIDLFMQESHDTNLRRATESFLKERAALDQAKQRPNPEGNPQHQEQSADAADHQPQ